MNILLIGNKNHWNDAVKGILLTERGIKADYLVPSQLVNTDQKSTAQNNGNYYSCTLLDLTSFESAPGDVVYRVNKTIQTDRLIAIYFYDSRELIQTLLQNGVDPYLPVGFTRDDLFKVLDGMSH